MGETSLERKVEALEEKAEEYARLENIDAKVDEANTKLKELNRDLGDLENELEQLEHYTEVLTKVFEENQPASVDDARARARDVITDTRSDIVTILVSTDRSLDRRRDKIGTARSKVDDAMSDVDDRLDNIRDEWMSKIDSARGVLRIVGGSRELEVTMDDMENILKYRMKDESEDLSVLRSDWKGYTTKWEDEGINWEEFQQEHGITDETVDCLKELSRGHEVKLANVSEAVIDDLHRVKEIGAELKLKL